MNPLLVTRSCSVLLGLCGLLSAQESAPSTRSTDKGAATISEARVRAVLEFLASDDLLGRDTPSPGLTAAGEFLKKRYAEAGLTGGAKAGSFFHEYTLAGSKIDSTRLGLRYADADGKEHELVPDVDARILRTGGKFESELGEVEVLTAEEFGKRGSGRGQRARKPMLVLVGDDDLLWRASAGLRGTLNRGGAGEAPIVLVRAAALGDQKIVKAALSVPEKEAADLEVRNVVAMLEGGAKKDQIVIVSSHYDHIGIGGAVNGDSINNGADDDASGTTAVLLLAEALAARGEKLPRTFVFVNFSGEEKGLRGSQAFAANPPFPLDRAICNLNLEMLGRPTPDKRNQAWLTGRKLSDLESIVAPALARAGITCVEFEMEGQLFFQSDNLSLAKKGVVAHSISAGHLHKDYHRPSDEVSRIDIPHMTAVVRGLYEACLDVGSREAVPAYNEDGKTLLKR